MISETERTNRRGGGGLNCIVAYCIIVQVGLAGNIPVETQYLAEDEDQHHADEYPRLLHVCPDALVTHDADAVPGGQARHADGDAAA